MYVIEIRKGEERAASEFYHSYYEFCGRPFVETCIPVAWAFPFKCTKTYSAQMALRDCKEVYPDCDVRFVDAVTTQPV